MRRSTFAAGLTLLIGLLPSSAFAFCRATTCDPNDPMAGCQRDTRGCVITGFPLAWRSNCVTVGVQQMGAPKEGFTYDEIAPVVEEAFGAWMNAGCGNGTPSIDVKLIGPIECGVSEYNSNKGNANIVLFREDDWPYPGAANAVGLTTNRFDTKTGELWDADIELNNFTATFSIGDPILADDLLSVLTHESGHFLGLGHSDDPNATMKPVYDAVRDGATFRSLTPDDVEAICTVYPPDRTPGTTSCDNRHGFSSQCGADQKAAPAEAKGCSLNARAGAPSATSKSDDALWAFIGVLGVTCLARRRRIVYLRYRDALSPLLLVWLLARFESGDRVEPLVK